MGHLPPVEPFLPEFLIPEILLKRAMAHPLFISQVFAITLINAAIMSHRLTNTDAEELSAVAVI